MLERDDARGRIDEELRAAQDRHPLLGVLEGDPVAVAVPPLDKTTLGIKGVLRAVGRGFRVRAVAVQDKSEKYARGRVPASAVERELRGTACARSQDDVAV